MKIPPLDGSSELWTEWLGACLAGRVGRHDLGLSRDEELHEGIIRLYREMPVEHRYKLESAISILLGSIPQLESNADQFFWLLQAIAVIKPVQAHATLRRLLAEGVVGTYEFAGRSLQTTLLVVTAKYPVDDWLTDVLWKEARDTHDFARLIICFRCLSYRMDNTCFGMLDILVRHLDSEAAAAQLSRQLLGVIDRLRCRGLREWYLAHIDRLSEYSTEIQERLNKLLHDVLIRVNSKDDNALLLLSELTMRRTGSLDPERLVEIAEMEGRLGSTVPETLRRFQDWSFKTHGTPLWEVQRVDPCQYKGGVDYLIADRKGYKAKALVSSSQWPIIKLLGNSLPADTLPKRYA